MKVFSETVGNGQSYEDYSSIIILVAANSAEEANDFVRTAIEKKEQPFDTEFYEREFVSSQPNLQTDLTETGIITYFYS
jgi:hypothetical protein